MKYLVFDTGSIISFAMNNLLFSLKDLKTRFGGEFIITEAVHQELVEHPMQTKRFKFEALQVLKVIKEGTITVYKNEQLGPLTQDLLSKANASCLAHHHPMQIVSLGEIEALAATIILKGEALVVDERTTRLLVEDPAALALHPRIFPLPNKRRQDHPVNGACPHRL